MREHLGEEYGGVVTSATSFGIFVTLDAMFVEGLVHITELGGEYFRFDEARQELRGERTGTRYAIGTRVRIQVSRVDLDGRKIDFRLVQEGEGVFARGLPDKQAVRELKGRGVEPERFEIEAGVRKRGSAKSASRSSASTRKSGTTPKPPNRKRR
jgi:ribonuclease R